MATALASAGVLSPAIGRPGAAANPGAMPQDKARAAAQDFEAVFLNSMFAEMFTAIGGEGPFGGGPGAGVWRSFLTDEYAKSFARAGGIGIGDQVYRTLLAQQEALSGAKPAISTP
jgi:Rod binding domain-containing protein